MDTTESEKQKKQYIKMTTEPVSKLLISLSIPTILSMMVTNIYNIVDTAFVGTLGTSQSGATGIVFGYMAILQAIAFMCGQGAGSIMSRKLGEKNLEEATKYASSGFFMSFSLGLLIGALSFVFMNPLLTILGSTATIGPYAKIYITYIIISAPFFTSSLTMNNLLRYEGRAKLGTVGLMTGAFINIGLDALFMFKLKMGIAGAGMATAISQITSFSILLFMFISRRTQTKIAYQFVAKDIETHLDIFTTGFPSLLRQGLNSIATMVLNNTSSVYGDEAVAAMSIVNRIGFMSMSVAIGIGQGFQPICGFNFGADKKDRVKRAFWTAFIYAEIISALISIPIYIFADPLIRLLRDDNAVVVIGIRALRLMCLGQLFVPFTMMIEMGFQSTGARLLATFSSSLRNGILLIPTIIILSVCRGLNGIQEAQPLAFVLAFVIGIFTCQLFLKRMK